MPDATQCRRRVVRVLKSCSSNPAMNTTTPRVFIAATRQNDGKTTTSLGLIAALQTFFPRVGYIKPVGQRFVEIEEQKIDEDTVLMDAVYRLELPARGHEPHRRRAGFHAQISPGRRTTTRSSKRSRKPSTASRGKRILCCAKAPGHAGVGSVFDLSNAQVAKMLGCKVIIVTRGRHRQTD